MVHGTGRNTGGVTKHRLEAFSDGVFAIAITLLVIELRAPEPEKGTSLAEALWDMWPGYAAYLVSFTIIGVMWLNHHRVFDQVRTVDAPLLVLNLHLLLWAALIPFPTAVMADFLREGDDARTAVAFYSAVILMAAISFSLLYARTTRDRVARLRYSVGVLAYVVALGLSFAAPYVALAFHGAMALYYLFDQATVATERAPER